MSGFTVDVSQQQALELLARAEASLSLVVQALQQVIASAQATGAANVTLSAELLQGLAAQIELSTEAVIQARIRQQQQSMVRIRRQDLMIMVRLRQQQIGNILARARASLSATLRTVQSLLATAQAMGGSATISLIAAQQLLVELQAVLSSVVEASAAQRQNIQIIASQAQA